MQKCNWKEKAACSDLQKFGFFHLHSSKIVLTRFINGLPMAKCKQTLFKCSFLFVSLLLWYFCLLSIRRLNWMLESMWIFLCNSHFSFTLFKKYFSTSVCHWFVDIFWLVLRCFFGYFLPICLIACLYALNS